MGLICCMVIDVVFLFGVMVGGGFVGRLWCGVLCGVWIGVDSWYFMVDFGGELDLVVVVWCGFVVMAGFGAMLIEIDIGDLIVYGDVEFMVLLFEFKV